jgi:hypothetical protein
MAPAIVAASTSTVPDNEDEPAKDRAEGILEFDVLAEISRRPLVLKGSFPPL